MADLRLPWHRETIGHANVEQIAEQVARDLAVPFPDGIPPNTDATWIVNADNKVVAFVGNGPRQTDNADAIVEAVRALAAEPTESLDAVTLANVIREVDGNHDLGAGELAERILSHPRLSQALRSEQDKTDE